MTLGQEIKFKNGIMGNPRSLFIIYEQREGSKWALPRECKEVGYEGTYQLEQNVDVVLPKIYTYESYRVHKKYLS